MRKVQILAIPLLVVLVLLIGMVPGCDGAGEKAPATTPTAPLPTVYTLSTSVSPSGAGTVTPAGGAHDAGTVVTLTANPAQGYVFDHWSGDATGISNSVTVTMDSSKSIVANFKTQYTLSTSVSPSGTGTVAPSSGTYNDGTEVALTATPAQGYVFDHWSGDATGTSSPITVVMNSDKSIVAHFEALPFTSDDGRVTFVLDNVDRTKEWPAELSGGRTPKAGYDFVVVYVTIASITDGHVTLGGADYTIVDNNGIEYEYISWAWTGVKYYDLTDIRSAYEFIEGSQAILIFELPENAIPVKVKLNYLFFSSWSPSGQYVSEEERYIDIILP